MTSIDVCPRCGAEIHTYQDGPSRRGTCSNCGWTECLVTREEYDRRIAEELAERGAMRGPPARDEVLDRFRPTMGGRARPDLMRVRFARATLTGYCGDPEHWYDVRIDLLCADGQTCRYASIMPAPDLKRLLEVYHVDWVTDLEGREVHAVRIGQRPDAVCICDPATREAWYRWTTSSTRSPARTSGSPS